MDFSFNDDQLALRDAVRRFCDGEYPKEHRGNPETADSARTRWQGMAELGLLGLPLPAEAGGSEQGAVEVMVVAQELGRALGGGAFVPSTVMAGSLLKIAGTAGQQARWLTPMAEGSLQAAVAIHEPGARYDWHDCQLTARAEGSDFILSGRKSGVMHGDTAGLWLIVVRLASTRGLSVLAVDAGTPGVTVQGYDTLDGRRAAHLHFEGARVPADHLLGIAGGADAAIEAALDAGIAALCAESAGAVEALLEHTAEHLRTRKQFGAPLAKFQALQHRVADMAIALEQLKSMACAAAMAVDAGEPAQRARLVSGAKVLAGQLGRRIGLEAIQLHGAMGMTDECRVGHYAKRLIVIGQSLGDASWHLSKISARADTPERQALAA